jgi:TIR domain
MNQVAERPAEASVQKVFICYRREETGAHAGRLYDAMVARFGEENVFMDLDLAPGVDFEKRITQVVSGCVALLVVMGPNWARTSEADGTRRIDNPGDFVRLEVETGLQRPDVTPIPVLVNGARMPRREELPPELRSIARRNAIELSDGRWRYDVNRLLETLDELLPEMSRSQAAQVRKATEGTEPTSSVLPRAVVDWRLALEGMLVAGMTAVAARLLTQAIPAPAEVNHGGPGGPSQGETALHIGGLVLRRTTTTAVIGIVLAVWLASRIGRSEGGYPWKRGLLIGALAGAIGGLLWALPSYGPQENLHALERAEMDLRGLTATGALMGVLIGSLWRPRRVLSGLVGGAIGGFLFQLVVVLVNWDNSNLTGTVVSYGLASVAIVGFVFAAMAASERWEGRAERARAPATS